MSLASTVVSILSLGQLIVLKLGFLTSHWDFPLSLSCSLLHVWLLVREILGWWRVSVSKLMLNVSDIFKIAFILSTHWNISSILWAAACECCPGVVGRQFLGKLFILSWPFLVVRAPGVSVFFLPWLSRALTDSAAVVDKCAALDLCPYSVKLLLFT